MVRKLCKKIKTQIAQLTKTHRQNSQLIEINNSLSQTHTDIGVLLTERQESDGDREIITEVRALLDKNDDVIKDLQTGAEQGV